VWFVRTKLELGSNPALQRPAFVQVTADLDGQILRAHASARTMRDAIDRVDARLRDQIEHRAERRDALHRDGVHRDTGAGRLTSR
jgi:ribosome-associated translation inhibitor RaiA